MKMIRPSRWV